MKVFWSLAAAALAIGVVAGAVFYFSPLWVSDQALRFGLWQHGVKSRYIEAGGHRLHYFESPPSDGSKGTPILLVHGLGARGEDWAPMITGLAGKGFHVYAPDLLGYGRSPQPDASYSIAMEEQAVFDFMNAVHLERPDVGGWSMGGWIAMKLTLDHPERVNRLVVYDSAGVYFEAAGDADLFTPQDAAGVGKLMAVLSPRPLKLPSFVARDVVQRNREMAWVIRRSVAAMMDGRDLLDFKLQGISRPTLVVWGSRDDLIPLAVGERIHRGIQGSSLDIVEGCGHLAPAECWRPVLEGTVEFLRAEPAPKDGRRVFPAE